MTTTALTPIGLIGARRVVGEELRALAECLGDAEWPPWDDVHCEYAIGCLRHTIDQQLERAEDDLPVIASRLGLDFDALQDAAADRDNVRRWVSVFVGPAGRTDVMAELLMVHLFADELAFLGMLSRPIGPVERKATRA